MKLKKLKRRKRIHHLKVRSLSFFLSTFFSYIFLIVVNTTKKGFDPEPKKKKKMKSSTFVSKSLDFDKTKNLYEKTNRITVEVLDDTSPDHSPRFADDDQRTLRQQESMMNTSQASIIYDSEESFKNLKFSSEKTRVSQKSDIFVPGPGITIHDIEIERLRLTRLEETARKKQLDIKNEIQIRKVYLARDRAVIKIQALFRSYLGKKKFNLTKRLFQMNHGKVTEWIEVRDKESGEIWYYNTMNGVSQWEKPEALRGKVSSPDKIKKLPILHSSSSDKSQKSKISKLLATESLPKIHHSSTVGSNNINTNTMTQTTIPTWEDEHGVRYDERDPKEQKLIENELSDAFGLATIDSTALLAPDGSFKPQLRETIRQALSQTRFDSVSTVLADERWYTDEDEKKGTEVLLQPKNKRTLVDPSRKPMTAILTFNKHKTGAGVKLKKSTAEDEQLQAIEQSVSRSEVADLTLKSVDHAGFGIPSSSHTKPENMCFGCWSAGSTKQCHLHLDHNDKHTQSKSQSMILCRNWELAVMRRRYRSEEIQEIFMKKSSSLRYDNKRKKFISIIEQRHPLYRSVHSLLQHFNNRSMLLMKTIRWMKSFAEEIRMGKVKPQRTAEKSRLLRLKHSVTQWGEVNRYTSDVIQLLPIAPTTGYTWPERMEIERYLFNHSDPSLGIEVQLIIAPPTPVPIILYEPRVYHLITPKSIPMPRPDYSSDGSPLPRVTNVMIDASSTAGWLELLSSSLVTDVIHNVIHQIDSMKPIKGIELMRRSKYPSPSSVKFASIGKKATPGLLAKGGLPIELLVSQLVTTYIPPQYGNFMVMDKSTISPGVSPEGAISFVSIPMAPILQLYIHRHLEHPLNYRRSPAVTISSKASIEEKWMYGTNRPEQTGERESHGFRTTAWARHLLTNDKTNPRAFTPGAEVVSLNLPGSNKPFTTHADYTYPFCEPSTRDNTTLDFYHLLLTGLASGPKSQLFTVLTQQDPGRFQSMSNTKLAMGHILASVYRSWSFTQRAKLEEFKSDDGIPYWYNRESGQTFWEKPLVEEEMISPLEGGTIVDPNHCETPFTLSKGEPHQSAKYHQGEVRKNVLMHHETEEEAMRRRRNASTAAKVARQKGKIPDIVEGASRIVNESSTVSDVVMDSSTKIPQLQLQLQNNHSHHQNEKNLPLPSPAGSDSSKISTESSLLSHQQEKLFAKQYSTSGLGHAILEDDERSDLGDLNSPINGGLDPNIVQNLATTLGQMMSQMDLKGAKPQDMIQLGLGMGMALMQQTMGNQGHKGSEPMMPSPNHRNVSFVEDSTFSDSSKDSLVSGGMIKGQPIGIPKPSRPGIDEIRLNHHEETQQQRDHQQLEKTQLTSMEKALEVKVQPTITPDELQEGRYFQSLPGNADQAVKKKVPVIVYPELSTQIPGGGLRDYTTHAPAGIGTSFVLEQDADTQTKVANSNLRLITQTLPIGFFGSIEAKRVAKQQCDYLPQVPNLPQSHTIGRVKPRSAAIDWIAIGFDPWSAGRKPLNSEFIPSLASKAEQMFDLQKLLEKKGVDDGTMNLADSAGLLEQNVAISKAQKHAEDFRKVCSLCRHNKFGEVEEMMNHPDWSLGMDYQDDAGNSLLHIAAQNGNKRMIKLCLRRGAPLNTQNLNGQTPLHFAFAYGYTDVGEYLVGKGADDSIRNKDGLTCYEGLDADEIEK
jgi:hypothetical protein